VEVATGEEEAVIVLDGKPDLTLLITQAEFDKWEVTLLDNDVRRYVWVTGTGNTEDGSEWFVVLGKLIKIVIAKESEPHE